ncbi:hypothetical protein ACG2LH_06755 [Zhouia sp. PK063]|uniref:hypothetical protein n=1 Tax=Zhouia sp. PK063 TaxID=3373602 RepID=UPI003799EA6B
MRKLFYLFFMLNFILACSSDSDSKEETEQSNVSYQVKLWKYDIDKENDSIHWEYKIDFKNNSSFNVSGYPLISFKEEGADMIIKRGYEASSTPCKTIAAGEDCLVAFKQDEKINYNVQPDPKPLVFVNAEYFIETE